MKGHFKNQFTPCLKTNTFWKFPWGAGEDSRGRAGVGLAFGHHKEVSAD